MLIIVAIKKIMILRCCASVVESSVRVGFIAIAKKNRIENRFTLSRYDYQNLLVLIITRSDANYGIVA